MDMRTQPFVLAPPLRPKGVRWVFGVRLPVYRVDEGRASPPDAGSAVPEPRLIPPRRAELPHVQPTSVGITVGAAEVLPDATGAPTLSG
jgi:hypothetical protein